jgi:molecular chaperone DnaK (HSP70)
MNQSLQKVFGIDLGTTYSGIAHVDEFGKAVIIPNYANNRVTPSVVLFDDGSGSANIVVGEEAKNSLAISPEKVASFVKREMGQPNWFFLHNGVNYKAEEISSYILRKLVQDAEQNLGVPVKDVVITCPAYFGINEREATRIAGELAGLNVKAIINEPTAAAIAYGFDTAENKVVLVYDLGGGTFDVTMIEIRPESIRAICTGGDKELGGKNWDDALMTYFAERFKEETGSTEDIFSDPETLGDLQLLAEKTKQTLSVREKTPVAVTHGGEKARLEMSREKFEEITNGLLERTITLTHDMLAEAKRKGYDRFDEIILVGGSTRMPQVKERVDREFGIDAKIYDPDEAVAKGAAIFAHKTAINDELIRRIAEQTGQDAADIKLEEVHEETLQQVRQEVADNMGLALGQVQKAATTITNVASKSFGLITTDPATGQEFLTNLIFKNDPVPREVTKRFGTLTNNQDSVLLTIKECEVSDPQVDPTNANQIGEARLTIPSGLPAGSPIDVTFQLNDEGRLDIRAVEATAFRTVEIVIQTASVISGQELEEAKQRSTAISII